MWFMRDLMVINLLSPAIHWALRQGKRWFLLALLVLCLLQLWPPGHNLGITCLYYYSVGAYIAIQRKSMTDTFQKKTTLMVYSWNTTYAGGCIPAIWILYMKPFWCIVWSISFINLIVLFATGLPVKMVNSLADSTFFIYAIYSDILSNIRQALLVLPSVDFGEIKVFILTGVISVSIYFLLYWLLRRCLPRTCALICGR